MRTHTSDFKTAISTAGRQINSKITYYKNGTLKTVNNILSIAPSTHTDLLKTVMKELTFTSKEQINKNTIIKYEFGVMVDDEYEYLNMGEYIVKENDWDADLNAFTHECYDTMLYTMVDYYTPTNITYPITVNDYIKAIANECGLDFDNYNTPFCNSTTLINEEHFSNLGYTFRDVLDYIAEIVAGWIIINSNGDLQIKYPTETNEEFNADFLNNYNITFKGKYGAVNSIVFSRGGDSDTIYRRDENDINSNGLHELKIEGNPFLEGMDRENFIDDVYNELHGLEYYVTDIVSTGICYLEVGDYFTFDLNKHNAIKSGMAKSGLYKAQSETGGKIKCILLNDELDLSDGISETIYAEEPMMSVTDYKSSSPTDKSIKNAIILTNKNAGQIVLKANSEGKLVQVELNGDANNGSEFNVKADNINLEGYTTINNGFSVDENGNATMNNATITGGSINLSGNTTNPKFIIKNISDNTRYTDYYPNSIRMVRNNIITLVISNTTASPIIQLINVNDENEKTTITSAGITTPTVTQTSKEEYKKNFEKLENAKEILKNTDIYKYNLINDEDTDKKHIGLVIGGKYNYSKEITSKNNDGVDIYSMVSVLWQVVKEQEEEIKLLKERIDK